MFAVLGDSSAGTSSGISVSLPSLGSGFGGIFDAVMHCHTVWLLSPVAGIP